MCGSLAALLCAASLLAGPVAASTGAQATMIPANAFYDDAPAGLALPLEALMDDKPTRGVDAQPVLVARGADAPLLSPDFLDPSRLQVWQQQNPAPAVQAAEAPAPAASLPWAVLEDGTLVTYSAHGAPPPPAPFTQVARIGAGQSPVTQTAMAAPALPDAQVKRLEAVAQDVPPPSPVQEEDKPAGEVEQLAEAVLLAVSENPDIQISKARQDDAYYGTMESRAGFLPKVDLAISGGSELNAPNSGNTTVELRREGTLTVRQTLWNFGLTLNDLRRAKALYESAEWATREKIESITFDISSAYIGVLERQRIAELARDNVVAHKRILRMVEVQRELGLSTGADVSRVQARLSNVEAALQDRESERDQAKENYRRLVNRLPARVVDPPIPDLALPSDADAAVELIDERSPQLMQTLSDQRSLEAQRRSQVGALYPSVDLEMQGNWKEQVQGDTGRARDTRAMVVMRYNLFNGFADYAVKKRIDARLREIGYEVERVRREVEQDIRSDFRALDASRRKVATVDSEVQAAQNVVDLYAEQFKTGKRTAFDLLDGQQALVQARTNQISNRFQSVISGYRVLQKLGLLFDHISTTPHNKI